jgi:hypothetical protein
VQKMTILVARIGAFPSAIVFFGCADYLIPTHKAQSAAAHAERESKTRGRGQSLRSAADFLTRLELF